MRLRAEERIKRQALMRALDSVRITVKQAKPGNKLRALEISGAAAIKAARGQMLTGDVSAVLQSLSADLDLNPDHGYDPNEVTSAIAGAIKLAEREPPSLVGAPLFDPWQTYIAPMFPLDVLPGSVQQFVETQSRIIGCDPAALAMCALCNFSAAIDHRFRIKMLRYGTWLCSPRLWVVIVGDPSDRKSPCINAATYHLTRIEADQWDAWDREKAVSEDDKIPAPPRLWTADTTVDACGRILAKQTRGLLVKRDELAGWIGSMERYNPKPGASSDRAFWLEAYDGGPFTIDRIGRGTLRVQNLSTSIIGGFQPDRLKELCALTTDGLLQRFIPVMMRHPTEPIDEPTDAAFDAYGKLTRTLLNAIPATVIMTNDALERAAEIRKHRHNLEQASGGLAQGFRGFVGKLHGTLGSLALILHMLDKPLHGGAFPVEMQTIERAARLIDDFILPHALTLYELVETGRPESETTRKIASYILTTGKGRIVPSDLTVNVSGCRGADMKRIADLVSPLVAGGWLKPEYDSLFPKAWRVEPLVHAQLAHRRAEEEQRKVELAKLMNSRRKPQELASA